MAILQSLPLLARGEEGFFVVLVIGVLGIGLVIRLLAGTFDRERIYRYVQDRGGKVRSIHWSPFGRGWFGDKNHRIYDVAYDDAGGQQHFATCKTSLWGGVYWTEDELAASTPVGKPALRRFDDPAQLAQENDRLHAEVRRLKQELKARG